MSKPHHATAPRIPHSRSRASPSAVRTPVAADAGIVTAGARSREQPRCREPRHRDLVARAPADAALAPYEDRAEQHDVAAERDALHQQGDHEPHRLAVAQPLDRLRAALELW